MSNRDKEVLAAAPEGVIFSYISYASSQTDAPLIYHLGSALAVLSALASAARLRLWLGGRWVPVNGYACLVGPTRNRKTTAAQIARDLLAAVAEQTGHALLGPAPDSPEALAERLLEQPEQMIIYAEFGRFLAQTAQGPKSVIRDAFVEAFDSGVITRSLVARASVSTQCSISILGACTESHLVRSITETDIHGGFLSRFSFWRGGRISAIQLPGEPDAETRDLLVGTFAALAAAKPSGCLGLGEAAGRRYLAWVEGFNELFDGATPAVASMLAGAPELVLKWATLLAFSYGDFDEEDFWLVGSRHVDQAIGLINLHIEAAVDLARQLGLTPFQRMQMHVLSLLDDGEPHLEEEVHRHCAAPPRAVKEVIQSLQMQRRITTEESADGQQVFALIT